MENTNGKPQAEISRVAVRLPPFWAERPAVWFAQAEAQFTVTGISSEQTEFCYVISQLDHRYATEVEDIITSPPERDPCTTMTTEIVGRLSPLKEQRIRHYLRSRRWATASRPSFWGLAQDEFLCSIWTTPQLTGRYRPFSSASPRASWTPRPASSRPQHSRRSQALRHTPKAT
jgi:hypothetical protein